MFSMVNCSKQNLLLLGRLRRNHQANDNIISGMISIVFIISYGYRDFLMIVLVKYRSLSMPWRVRASMWPK